MSTTRPLATRGRPWIAAVLAMSAAAVLLAAAAQAQTPAPAAPPDTIDTAPPVDPLSGLRIRGYGDVSYGTPLQEKLPPGGLQASTYSFQIADLHLFVTAKLAEDWSVLSEILFTSDFSNESSVELDRLLIQYYPNKHLRIGFGKFNAAVGYYSNEFHRAKFYQTATGRPMMFADEDNGGILPVHQVGITVQGEIPSGALGLHYIGELTNGRAYTSHGAEVQNFVDVNNAKAVNVGLFVRPDGIPALDAGFTVYRDTPAPEGLRTVRETIVAAHAVYLTPTFEFLNEFAVLTHDVEASGLTATSKTFYTQVSNRFGLVRPYARYEFQNVPETDPVFGIGDVAVAAGLRKAVSLGLNVGIGTYAVVKVQFDRALQFDDWANGAHVQLAFAF